MVRNGVVRKVCVECDTWSVGMWCKYCFPGGFPKPFKYRSPRPRLKPLRGL